jgi:hypothetical protein
MTLKPRNLFHRILAGPAFALAALIMLAAPASAAPPVTNGLKLSLDASALTGLSNGDTVTTWTDTSGLGNHAAASSTVNVATWQTNALNGKPVVRFKSNGNASFNFNRVSNIRTVFWVLKNTKPDFRFMLGDSDYADFDPGDAPSFPLWRVSTPDVIRKGTTKLMGNVVDGTTTALPSSSYSLLSLVTTGDVRANQLSLDRNNAGRSWAGDMAEVLIYDRALTTGEEAFVGSYLASKYGLTTAYPPFKLGVSFTAPANGEVILSGTSVIATADILDPGAFTPHTVTFHVTPTSPSGPKVSTTDTSAPYTADLGKLAAGTYEIYETIVNSATPAGMATSATRTFTVAPAVPTTTTLTAHRRHVTVLRWCQCTGFSRIRQYHHRRSNHQHHHAGRGNPCDHGGIQRLQYLQPQHHRRLDLASSREGTTDGDGAKQGPRLEYR